MIPRLKHESGNKIIHSLFFLVHSMSNDKDYLIKRSFDVRNYPDLLAFISPEENSSSLEMALIKGNDVVPMTRSIVIAQRLLVFVNSHLFSLLLSKSVYFWV